MIFYAFLYILLVHFLYVLSQLRVIVREYYIYIKTTDDTFTNFCINIILDYKERYIGAIFEEVIFRMPLLYINNNFVNLISIIIFSLNHYKFDVSFKYNLQALLHTLILAIFFTHITLLDRSIIYPIGLHIINNILVSIELFGRDYKRKNCRKISRFLDGI
jgi:hypothetical protein